MTVDSLTSFVLSNPLTVFNSLLLILTARLSVLSYNFQARAGIRESLEQLEDLELNRHEKLSPILHQFEKRYLRHSKSIVQLKYYRVGANPASASGYSSLLERGLSQLQSRNKIPDGEEIDEDALFDDLIEELLKIGLIQNVYRDEEGVYLVYQSSNAVDIRRGTEKALNKIRDWHFPRPEEFTMKATEASE